MSNRVGDIYREIKEPTLRVLYRHWDEMRGGRVAPVEGALDPAGVPVLHGCLALVETANRIEDFRVRYFGETLRSRFAQERREMTFAQIARIADLQEPLEGYWTTYSRCAVTYLSLVPMTGSSPKMSFSRLLLPFTNAGTKPAGILCGFAFLHTRNRPAGKLVW